MPETVDFCDLPLTQVLGEKTAKALTKAFGFDTVGGLLGHYPRRYAERGELTALDALPLDESVTIVAEVVRVNNRPMNGRKGSLLEVIITDGTGRLSLTFFNQAWRARDLRTGARGIFAGKVSEFRGTRQLTHPDYELFDADESVTDEVAAQWASTPIPIYPATSTVASWQIARSLGVILDVLPELPDPVPEEFRSERRLLNLREALLAIHRPAVHDDWRAARETLRFHEAFLVQTALLRDRARHKAAASVPRTPAALRAAFDAALPYELTADQRTVGDDIDRDMAQAHPMHRLVQGEVGSGKTLVAIRAMLTAIEDGGQAALIAPTEVLATQHARSISATLGTLAEDLNPTLLVGGLPAAEKKRANLAIASGAARFVIGTHALLSDTVQFNDLALVVIDEQHRFGVEQRDTLRQKGTSPHTLVLTATPIPRTVAMTVFGDLDISTIRTMPAGRAPIQSHVVPLADKPGWWPRVWSRLGEELDQGRQAFIVCSAIDPTTDDTEAELLDDAPVTAARHSVTETLPVARQSLPGRRVEPLHGRMSADEKDATMRAFAAGEIDVLVATTVIEVGVDVPNASTMVVLDSDRFGVSQLHQLRGRVGRGGVPGLALFVTTAEHGTLARERVDAVASTLDGFELAQKDLELRREGDVLGERQSGGRSGLALLRVAIDGPVIEAAREAAEPLVTADPSLSHHPALRDAVDRRLSQREREFLGKA
ncbi:MAG: ATP-dependent helicase RecG [Actinomycetota bacterium]